MDLGTAPEAVEKKKEVSLPSPSIETQSSVVQLIVPLAPVGLHVGEVTVPPPPSPPAKILRH